MGSILSHKEEILRLYQGGGWSVSAIAKRIGCHTTAVSAFLSRQGLRTFLRGAPQVSVELEKKIATLYKRGVGSTKIAARFGIAQCTVIAIARRNGLDIRATGTLEREFSRAQVKRMGAMWLAGKSQQAIADRFDTTQAIVSRTLRRAGIKKDHGRPEGARHGKWKGGRYMVSDGYWWVKLPTEHPLKPAMANRMGYAAEHRWLMALKLGRPLTPNETVHHINGDKADNRIENLQLRMGKHGKNECYRCRACGSHDIEAVPLAAH